MHCNPLCRKSQNIRIPYAIYSSNQIDLLHKNLWFTIVWAELPMNRADTLVYPDGRIIVTAKNEKMIQFQGKNGFQMWKLRMPFSDYAIHCNLTDFKWNCCLLFGWIWLWISLFHTRLFSLLINSAKFRISTMQMKATHMNISHCDVHIILGVMINLH